MQERVDARPLIFCRVCFGALMVVYSASKCSDDLGNHVVDDLTYGFEQRVPWLLTKLAREFPYFTDSHLYWHLHAPLMLASAIGITFGSGVLSRSSCAAFAVLKIVLTMLDQTVYNNHEYLYAVLALVFALLGGHGSYSSGGSTSIGLSLVAIGSLFMSLQNSVLGIPGNTAMVGMFLFIWPGIVLSLARMPTEDKGEDGLPSGDVGTLNEESFVPFWHVLYVRLLVGSLYLFAGFAKTDYDWLSGQTVRELFRLWTGPTCSKLVRSLIINADIDSEALVWGGEMLVSAVTYGGLLVDLLALFALNAKSMKVRVLGSIGVASFHLINHWNFVIETFPWVMLSMLAIQFDPTWVDHVGMLIQAVLFKLMRLHVVGSALFVFLKYATPAFLLCLMLLHLLVPLSCAINSVGDDGSLVWGSYCSFFRWRMMTRSVRTLSTQLRFKDSISNRIDYIPMLASSLYPDVTRVKECTAGTSLERYGHEREEAYNMFLLEAASYEDRLAFIVRDALSRVVPADETLSSSTPDVFADIWLEINGPPYQRYVDPTVNLAVAADPYSAGEERADSAWYTTFASLLDRPQPLATWVLPRLLDFRTSYWKTKFRMLEQSVARRSSIISSNIATSRNSVVTTFVADHADLGFLRLNGDRTSASTQSSLDATEFMLLSGEVLVWNTAANIDGIARGVTSNPLRLTAGTCMRLRGTIVTQSQNSQPALWMVVSEKISGHATGRIIGIGGGAVSADKKPPQLFEWKRAEQVEQIGGEVEMPKAHEKFKFCMTV